MDLFFNFNTSKSIKYTLIFSPLFYVRKINSYKKNLVFLYVISYKRKIEVIIQTSSIPFFMDLW
jgi:hypothetical protein